MDIRSSVSVPAMAGLQGWEVRLKGYPVPLSPYRQSIFEVVRTVYILCGNCAVMPKQKLFFLIHLCCDAFGVTFAWRVPSALLFGKCL